MGLVDGDGDHRRIKGRTVGQGGQLGEDHIDLVGRDDDVLRQADAGDAAGDRGEGAGHAGRRHQGVGAGLEVAGIVGQAHGSRQAGRIGHPEGGGAAGGHGDRQGAGGTLDVIGGRQPGNAAGARRHVAGRIGDGSQHRAGAGHAGAGADGDRAGDAGGGAVDVAHRQHAAGDAGAAGIAVDAIQHQETGARLGQAARAADDGGDDVIVGVGVDGAAIGGQGDGMLDGEGCVELQGGAVKDQFVGGGQRAGGRRAGNVGSDGGVGIAAQIAVAVEGQGAAAGDQGGAGVGVGAEKGQHAAARHRQVARAANQPAEAGAKAVDDDDAAAGVKGERAGGGDGRGAGEVQRTGGCRIAQEDAGGGIAQFGVAVHLQGAVAGDHGAAGIGVGHVGEDHRAAAADCYQGGNGGIDDLAADGVGLPGRGSVALRRRRPGCQRHSDRQHSQRKFFTHLPHFPPIGSQPPRKYSFRLGDAIAET